ncbi:MAG: acyltransferase domain-containing protein [Clostridia bacterium]|nr:acyltransferase domain-containing protein [Clostridia bacterium]
MAKSKVFLFSGQGSQFFQMAKDLFDHNETFREWMIKLDNIVYEISSRSMLAYIYDKTKNRGDRCDNIKYTHPAIFMVEYSLAMVIIENGIYPDLVIGSSLGEFTSIALSGVLSVRDTLECLLKQVECIETNCQRGRMTAVLHSAKLYEKTPILYENSELVGVNYDEHFVISGKDESLKLIAGYLKERSILFQELPVQYGFHSSLIEPAAKLYLEFLKKKEYKSPCIPIVSCLSGNMVSEISSDYLWNVVRMPILFKQAINQLEYLHSNIYLDLGPGSTLTNFIKRNLEVNSKSQCIPVITVYNQDLKNLEQVKKTLSEECYLI